MVRKSGLLLNTGEILPPSCVCGVVPGQDLWYVSFRELRKLMRELTLKTQAVYSSDVDMMTALQKPQVVRIAGDVKYN